MGRVLWEAARWALSGSEIGSIEVSLQEARNPALSARFWAEKSRGLGEGRTCHSVGGPRAVKVGLRGGPGALLRQKAWPDS